MIIVRLASGKFAYCTLAAGNRYYQTRIIILKKEDAEEMAQESKDQKGRVILRVDHYTWALTDKIGKGIREIFAHCPNFEAAEKLMGDLA